MGGSLFACLKATASGAGRGKLAPRMDPTASRHHQPVSWGELPDPILCAALATLPLKERCQAALVCRQWAALVASAAAHARDASAAAGLPATRLLPCDVDTSDEALAARLAPCRAVRHVPSAVATLDARGAATLQHLLSPHLTRLVLLDPAVVRHMQQQEGEAWVAPRAKTAAAQPDLSRHRRLRVLSVGMSDPLLRVGRLPPSLQALHLDLACGYSVQQLHSLCADLAAAAPALPHLQHMSLGLELDALVSSSHADVLRPLSGLTQLTSISMVEYQYMHPDSAAHDGYPTVPAVLQLLPRLAHAELRINSGHKVDLSPAAGVPDLHLALTLAHYEQEPFNRLPPSLVTLSGLTSLSILMAEFEFQPEQDLWVFDARPLALLPRLRSLLLELHGTKAALHDVHGLAELTGLSELAVLLKCCDVQEARQEAAPRPASLTGSHASSGAGSSGWAAALLGGGGGDPAAGSGGAGAFLASMQRMPRRLMSLLDGGSKGQQQHGGGAAGAADGGGNGGSAGSSSGAPEAALESQEWVLALLDHALDQIRPEFALSVPRMPGGRLLIATTNRLCLRAPEAFAAAGQPMLLASHLQLDLEACGDCWSGEAFLHPMGPRALFSWASRVWAPRGVELLAPARYPALGTYPGCTRRVDDRLLAAAPRGTPGSAVVRRVMAVAEERCLSYFS